MLKKMMFLFYTPLLAVILLLASLAYSFNTEYQQTKEGISGLLGGQAANILEEETSGKNITFEEVEQACSSDVELPHPLLEEVCQDITSGKITSIEEAKSELIEKAKNEVLSELDRAKKQSDIVALILYTLAVGSYALYLLMIFFARKEGIVFYGAVVLGSLLLLSLVVGLVEDIVFGLINNEVLNKLEPNFKAPAIEMLTYLKENTLPKIKGEAYKMTSLLLIAPIFVWGVHRITFGVKR